MRAQLRRRFAISLGVLVGLAVLPSYLWAFKLTTSSAAPTITIGGSFLVNKAAYNFRLPYSGVTLLQTSSPTRGDIVQFRHPDLPIIGPKRVVGLPGETIEFRENRVIVDGRVLPLRLLNRAEFDWVTPVNRIGSNVYDEDGHWISFTPGEGEYRTLEPVRLGPNEYFLVGDNRDNSVDSRVWGPIAERQILGKVIFIIHR
jgi:signal peptidase I